MTDDQFHAHRTTLANNFAAAGAELLEFMRAPGTLAAIPNTSPEQYVVAGDLVAIQALLPNRRERRGQRPKDELYFGPEAGQPRRWSILIAESGKGVVADYGYRFPESSAELERVDVVEVAAPVSAQAGQVAVPGWTSVDERLPGEQGQDSEEVLCFLSGHCAMTDFECRDGAGWGIRLGYYDAEKGMFRTGGRPDASVTHWMPLPATPSPAKESK